MKPILLIVAVVIAVVLVLAMRRVRKPVEMPFPEMLTMLQKEAVSIAKDSYGITLDYSPASVEKVEEILGKLYDEYQKKKTTEGQRGFALAFGVYIGAVMRKQAGEGRWERDHPQFGEGAMSFYWKDQTTFPVAWCLKRLSNGDEDNVWVKYRILVDEKLQKKKG